MKNIANQNADETLAHWIKDFLNATKVKTAHTDEAGMKFEAVKIKQIRNGRIGASRRKSGNGCAGRIVWTKLARVRWRRRRDASQEQKEKSLKMDPAWRLRRWGYRQTNLARNPEQPSRKIHWWGRGWLSSIPGKVHRSERKAVLGVRQQDHQADSKAAQAVLAEASQVLRELVQEANFQEQDREV